MRHLSLFVVVGMLAGIASAQETPPLENDSIIQMIKAGFDEATVVQLIKVSPSEFDTSIQGLLVLKNGGVSEAIIREMIAAGAPPEAGGDGGNSNGAGEAGVTGSPPGYPSELGVYALKSGKWHEVPPEMVTWMTGGFLKSMATAGLTKGHINGVVDGPHSRTQMSKPVEFLIIAPEGTSVIEYQLLKLEEKKDRREFRAITGGIIHASSGAKKNLVEFDYEKIGARMFRISLKNVATGEYGFLAPGAAMSASAATLGKMYTIGLE